MSYASLESPGIKQSEQCVKVFIQSSNSQSNETQTSLTDIITATFRVKIFPKSIQIQNARAFQWGI